MNLTSEHSISSVGYADDTLILVNTSGIFSVEVARGLCSAVSSDTIINVFTPPSFILLKTHNQQK